MSLVPIIYTSLLIFAALFIFVIIISFISFKVKSRDGNQRFENRHAAPELIPARIPVSAPIVNNKINHEYAYQNYRAQQNSLKPKMVEQKQAAPRIKEQPQYIVRQSEKVNRHNDVSDHHENRRIEIMNSTKYFTQSGKDDPRNNYRSTSNMNDYDLLSYYSDFINPQLIELSSPKIGRA